MYPLRIVRQFFYLVLPAEYRTDSGLSDEEVLDQFEGVTIFAATFIVLEIIYSELISRRNLYDFNDTLCTLSGFIILLINAAFMALTEYKVYGAAYQQFAIVELPDGPLQWIVSILLVDFVRYWGHRAMHEVAFMWTFHKFHHSSEYLNLTINIRGSFMQEFVCWPCYCFAALVVPPKMFAIHMTLNTLYPYWTHTQVIPNLGIFEKFFVTPSMHRVHHGRNPYCIDKNYGFVFRFWDQLFGTFIEERRDEPIDFGTVETTTTFNALQQQVPMTDIISKINASTTLTDKLKSLFLGPAWMPATQTSRKLSSGFQNSDPTVDADTFTKHASAVRGPRMLTPPNTFAVSIYVALQLALILFDLPNIVYSAREWSFPGILQLLFALWSISCLGYVLDNWTNLCTHELLRQAVNVSMLAFSKTTMLTTMLEENSRFLRRYSALAYLILMSFLCVRKFARNGLMRAYSAQALQTILKKFSKNN